jgi:circadian clock protein KaiC
MSAVDVAFDAPPNGDIDRRISTGSPEADDILGGGFPANSINIIMGRPGSGKTVFAEQLVFHNAADESSDERPILYLTMLSEPLAKVVSYLQRFDFYDETKLGTTVMYEDLGPALTEDGVDALVPRIREAITTASPRILVIDSFKVLHDLEPSPRAMRRLISDLGGLLSAYDVTTFLVGEYTADHVAKYPEFAVADGVVEFAREQLTSRDERFFRVLKLRGSTYRQGSHGIRITGAGVEFFPRLVSPHHPHGYRIEAERAPTGITGLDALMDGGVWRGSTTLVAGPTGSGKTTIAAQFTLQGIRSGEPALYVNFQENPTQFARLLASLGMRMDEAQQRGLHGVYTSPVELQIDSIISGIYHRIRESGIRRVVIDAVGDLYTAVYDAQRLHDYLYALTQHLTVNGVTSVLTFETPTTGLGSQTVNPTRELGFSYVADNILILTAADRVGQRTLRVLKTRHSDHNPFPHELELGSEGAVIGAAVHERAR